MMNFLGKYCIHILLSLIAFGVIHRLHSLTKTAPDTLIITFECKVSTDDLFQLFYIPEGATDFTDEHSIRLNVKGSQDVQEIRYAIPFHSRVKALRIDFGYAIPSGAEQEKITLEAVHLNNTHTDYVLRPDSIYVYFGLNGCASREGNSEVLITHANNGIYNPYMVSKDISSILDRLKEPVDAFPFHGLIFISFWFTVVFFIFHFLPPLTKARPLIQAAFVVAFIGILCAPLLKRFLFGQRETLNLEKRTLAKRPDFSLSKVFSKQFENYYNDHFGFRMDLIRMGSAWKTRFFNTSINQGKAMTGKEGFIFYNNADGSDQIFESYTHQNLLTAEQLSEYVNSLNQNHQKCAAAGIIYIEAFWPNKSTIYGDYLPSIMRLQIKDTLSKADQLINHLKESNSPVKIIDVRPALSEARKQNQVYYKFDTHWNSYGAYIGYKNLFDESYKELGIKPVPIDDFNIEWKERKEGDLLDLAGIGSDSGISELAPVFTYKNPNISYNVIGPEGYIDGARVLKCDSCSDGQRLLVFGDSYTLVLQQFFSLHFKEVIYIRTGYQQHIVDHLKPNVVIHCVVERYL